MHASLIRHNLGGLVPPKIATPKLVVCTFFFLKILFDCGHGQSGGSGAGLGPLVDFYSRLPKGRGTPRVGGIKARFFNGKNASGAPLVALIAGIFGVSYLLDYHRMYLL